MNAPFVDLVKYLKRKDIINLYKSGAYRPDFNNPDNWRLLIKMRYGVDSTSNDPRAEYIDRLSYDRVKKYEIEDILKMIPTYEGEIAIREHEDMVYMKMDRSIIMKTPNRYQIVDDDDDKVVTLEYSGKGYVDNGVPYLINMLNTPENEAIIAHLTS